MARRKTLSFGAIRWPRELSSYLCAGHEMRSCGRTSNFDWTFKPRALYCRPMVSVASSVRRQFARGRKYQPMIMTTLMDFEQMGGISELCKVFPFAAVRNITVMPHCFYDGPGLLAAIHVTSALGTADSMIEWRRFDLEAQIHDGALSPKSGRISVPQCPGLGLEPDPNVIRKYLRV